jgi:hypothetical protein
MHLTSGSGASILHPAHGHERLELPIVRLHSSADDISMQLLGMVLGVTDVDGRNAYEMLI